MSTLGTQTSVSKYNPPPKEIKTPGEKTDSRAGARKIQEKPETLYYARKQQKCSKMKGTG